MDVHFFNSVFIIFLSISTCFYMVYLTKKNNIKYDVIKKDKNLMILYFTFMSLPYISGIIGIIGLILNL